MEFNFVVGRYSLNNRTEKVIAGFLDVQAAKSFVTMKELDFLSNGYMYIDTPEGRHILGADRRTSMNKWYSPNEKVYIYDSREDNVISLEELILEM